VRWIDTIHDLTPVEIVDGMTFKRDDKFAPLGYGDINGAKLRQAIWLVDGWVKRGVKGIVSGSVSQSPQHAFISEICKHYRIGCVITHSKKKIEEKDSPYLFRAKRLGAKMLYSKVGYAKTLGALARKTLKLLPDHEFLETNITLEDNVNTWEEIEAFHSVGAEQVRNIPSSVNRLVIPCGSCNSSTSILYGLLKYPKPNLKEIILMGIGNHGSNNIEYIEHRLKHISATKGIDTEGVYDWSFEGLKGFRHSMRYENLNGTGYCQYSDTFHEKAGSIYFHPRYEGKCIRYFRQRMKEHWNEKTLFWIVGSDIR
tara:strand:+ start:5879 stop:6817 length:939 start_codon:yes stop_codon:yes gene_type:complete